MSFHSTYERHKELCNYLIFGIAATLTNFIASYVCFVSFHLDAVVSQIISNILAMMVGYVSNKLLVFGSKTNSFGQLMKEMFAFFASRVFTTLFDILFMWFTVQAFDWGEEPWAVVLIGSWVFDWYYLTMKLVSGIFVVIMNYFVSKFWIFKRKKEKWGN